ncbi:hypothetical protein ASZ90_006042 [hydrocarbon metagenome]|uniref:Glycosyltransferase 2-like domain-containing protein n=1 Tax=hydrocarbon metagenome TaxID=938273 RepID=A0A0W8FTD8_9ZZZZ
MINKTVFPGEIFGKNPLSIAIITKNEEENILYCLQSISFIRQIVVDSGSTDKTLEIAAESGCEVDTEEWHGFCPHSTLGAGTVFREGKSSTTCDAFMRAFFTFVQDYFPRLGILDICLA